MRNGGWEPHNSGLRDGSILPSSGTRGWGMAAPTGTTWRAISLPDLPSLPRDDGHPWVPEPTAIQLLSHHLDTKMAFGLISENSMKFLGPDAAPPFILSCQNCPEELPQSGCNSPQSMCVFVSKSVCYWAGALEKTCFPLSPESGCGKARLPSRRCVVLVSPAHGAGSKARILLPHCACFPLIAVLLHSAHQEQSTE